MYPASAVFSWWYSSGLIEALRFSANFLRSTFHFFSIPYLLTTLFAPWKRDVLKVQNAPLKVILEVLVLNLISRLVGATVRATTLLAGFGVLIFSTLVAGLFILGWLLWPLLVGLGLLGGSGLILGGSLG